MTVQSERLCVPISRMLCVIQLFVNVLADIAQVQLQRAIQWVSARLTILTSPKFIIK